MGNGGTQNTQAPSPPATSLAFFTTGDTSAFQGTLGGTMSSWFRKRAQTLASKIFGVATVKAATATLKALPPDLKLTKVYFVGHGNSQLFFFGGHPIANHNFECNDGQDLEDPANDPDSAAFLAELAKHLDSTGFEVGFIGCEVGGGFTGTVAKSLNGKGLNNGFVGGYTHEYSLFFVGAHNAFEDQLLDPASGHDENNPLVQASANQLLPYEAKVSVTP
jgi:hypothetical protein